jgi:Flp pilus assembly protein CpaB
MKPSRREDITSLLVIALGAFAGVGVTATLRSPDAVDRGTVRVEVRREVEAAVRVRIPDGYRAVSVPVDDVIATAGFVRPGSDVDVLVTLEDDGTGAGPVSRLVLQSVQVVGNDRAAFRNEDGQMVTTAVVTLLVTPQDAERLALAETGGRLHLALRTGGQTGP